MKLAIVYPEVYDLARFHEKRKEFPPFGPLYLAAVAEREGHEVAIRKISPGNTTLDLNEFDAIALSASSSATYDLIREARYTSRFRDDTLLLAGGVHANFFPEATLLDLKPHVVCVGEGEETLLELLSLKSQILSKEAEVFLAKVSGICFLYEGVPRQTGARSFNKSIDWLPLPARHLLDPSDVVMPDRLSDTDIQMAHVMLSRGCPFPCRFCAAASQRMQYRSGESARQELVHLRDAYGIGGFGIVDDNFIVSKKVVLAVCAGIEDLELQWSALSRVDTMDHDLLKALRRAGCIEIKYGMESGSEAILKAMDKRITRDVIRRSVRNTYEHGIAVKLFVIHGYPGEDLRTTEETLALLKELRPFVQRVSLFRFVPLPGTYVYNHAQEFALRNTDRQADWNGDWSRYHIHHNTEHWWGTDEQFAVVTQGFTLLKEFIDSEWRERYPPAHEAQSGRAA